MRASQVMTVPHVTYVLPGVTTPHGSVILPRCVFVKWNRR